VGNRKTIASTLSGVNSGGTFSYNTDDELSTDVYDNNGDTTHSGANSFSYDSENHLMGMNGGAVTLLYDGDGNRVAKTVGSVTTRYLVDDLNPTGYPQVVDELVGGAVTRQYTYGLDRISENQFVGGAWTPSFYGVDGGGSVRQLTNSSGTVTDTYEYDAFGNKVNSTGTTPNNYLYRGEQYDTDLSLYYLRARYYNPVTGRFLNVDPLAGRGQRRYEYAGANPVDGSDPSGNFVLASYWPQMAPLQINISFPSWCSQAGSGTMGSDLPPCKGLPWWITISYYPLGAKVVGGHIGVAIGQSPGAKNNDTYGWAPGWEGSPLSPRKPANGGKKFATTYVGIPIHPGILRDDKRTYNDWRSPHVDLYFKVNQSQRNFAKLDFDIRMTQSGLPSSYYDLYTRNCAEFGEDILRDAGVQGVPGHEIFWPHVVFLAMQGLADAEAANQ
jgi:RHS repeat-associated protein